MNTSIIKSISAVFVLSILIASQAFAAQPEVIITEVFVDFETQTITIMGENFNLGPNALVVTLGDFGSLNITTEEPNLIVVDFPVGGLLEGDYLLTVFSGPGPRKNADHIVTVGATGPEGPDGPEGPGGPEGPTGSPGTPGATGPAGADGATGPQGPQGNTGPAGSQGPQGDPGPQGAQGDTGPAGADGIDGMDGADGSSANINALLDPFAKMVFVTSNRYIGNLKSAAIDNFPDCSGVTTGLDGADCICQELAEAAGLSGVYAAWLGDDTGSPDTRFVKSFAQPYLRIDNKLVANDWTDLTDGTIANAINVNQNGIAQSSPGPARVWSAVNTNGTATGNTSHCNQWLGTSSANTGARGRYSATDAFWTEDGTGVGCGSTNTNEFYCFEQ